MTKPKSNPHSAEPSPVEPDNGLFFELFLDSDVDEPEIDWVAERQRREQLNLEPGIDDDLWFTLPSD